MNPTPQHTAAPKRNVTTVLAHAAEKIVGNFDIQQLLVILVKSTMELLDGEACSVYLRDEKDPTKYKCRYGEGYAQTIVDVAEYATGEGLTGWIAAYAQPVNIRSREELEDIKKTLQWKGKYDGVQWGGGKEFRNLAALPLRIGNETIGILKVENKNSDVSESFTDQDVENLQALALVFALAVGNANLQKENEARHAAISEAVHDLAKKIGGHITMTDLLERVLEITMERFSSEVCAVYLTKKENPNELECVAGAGYAKKLVGEAQYQIGEGFTGHIAKSKKWFNIKSLRDLDQLKHEGHWIKKYNKNQFEGTDKDQCENILAGPLLISDDEVLGVFKVENKIRNKLYVPYTSEDAEAFKTISRVVSLAIQNARLHEQIEQQLKTIASKAAHRIINQVTNYDFIHLDIEDVIKAKSFVNKDTLKLINEELLKTTNGLKSFTDEFKRYGKPLTLNKEAADITELISQEVKQAERRVPSDRIKIIKWFPPLVPAAQLDKAKISEAIKELLRNAEKAIQKSSRKAGTITITVVGPDDQRPGLNSGSRLIKVIVTDTGPGFPENARFFEPFTSTDPNSTGLGLSTVKELIDAHDGKVSARNLPEGGAEIVFELPLAE